MYNIRPGNDLFSLKMKKICFLVPGLNSGGIENYLLRVLKFLSDCSNITVIAIDGKQGDLYNGFLETGTSLRFQRVGFVNPLKWWRLYDFLRTERYNTICDFTGNFAGIPITIARMAGIENRIAFYRRSTNAFIETPLRLIYNKFVNYLVRMNSTKILSNSNAAFDFFFHKRNPDDHRFKLISNGIDPSVFQIQESPKQARRCLGFPENAFIIGHVGRYDISKNHATIFQVAQQINKLHKNVLFVFCGKGTDSKEFLTKVKESSIQDITFCIGLHDNIPRVLKTFDIFYFPSITEGQPNALIEAIMAGLPVLASDIPPIKEVLPESAHAKLLPPTDYNKAVLVLDNFIERNVDTSEYVYQKEISEKFGLGKNILAFLNEL